MFHEMFVRLASSRADLVIIIDGKRQRKILPATKFTDWKLALKEHSTPKIIVGQMKD